MIGRNAGDLLVLRASDDDNNNNNNNNSETMTRIQWIQDFFFFVTPDAFVGSRPYAHVCRIDDLTGITMFIVVWSR